MIVLLLQSGHPRPCTTGERDSLSLFLSLNLGSGPPKDESIARYSKIVAYTDCTASSVVQQ